MQKLFNIVSSMAVASVLLLVFAIASAVATFIENDFGTPTAKALVYNAWWFEAVMIALAISLGTNIVKQKLYQKEKIGSFLMHSSFIVILIGAGLTRYFGYEGIMHIREGESTSKIISTDSYITAVATSKGGSAKVEERVLFAKTKEQEFRTSLSLDGKSYEIKLISMIPDAVKQIEEVKDGKPMISLVVAASGGTPSQKLLEPNSKFETDGVSFIISDDSKLDDTNKTTVRFYAADSKLYFTASKDVEYMTMADRLTGSFKKGEVVEFQSGKLYNIEGVSFVPRFMTLSGAVKLVSADTKMKGQSLDSALTLEVSDGKEKKTVTIMGQPQALGEDGTVEFGDTKIALSYGSKELTLPLALKLNDFRLDRYPGSMSPSSYESNVTVIEEGKNYDYRIYMNHTLDANGFRFFQSSYDSDEMGTILSVSKDPGKWPTYLGYLLMSIGMVWLLVDKNGRFRKLLETLEIQKTAAALLVALSFFASPKLYADDNISASEAVAVLQKAKAIDKTVAKEFGNLLVQDAQGRIKPLNTLSIDILDKVSGSSSFDGMSADEVIYGMLIEPKSWQLIKMIKISHPEVKKLLGLNENDKKAAFVDFFDTTSAQGGYKLALYVDEANRKKPSERGTLDKEILKLDERLNICYMVYGGKLIRIFPKPNDKNNAWLDPATAVTTLSADMSNEIRGTLGILFENSSSGDAKDGARAKALEQISKIKQMQAMYGAAVMPSETKVSVELFYNKAQVFKNLIYIYLIIGLVLLVSEFASLSKESKTINIVRKISLTILTIGFALHTLNLAARWYISGHAPWSDGYESMTYIAWATVLAGILFTKKSSITLALTSILAGVVLFVAHLSWMDPQITNIVPVLKSYWLTIHVSMITASYGFLGLGALIGFVTLILMGLRSEARPLIDKKIRELAVINEMTLIIGLFMLTIGNFLGGVWANESWGRYWGWDPKETWALISILLYTIVVHSKYIPKLGSIYSLSVLSMFAFCSIVMTYFGVNFYLSGLHSYAQGDPAPIPGFVYISLAVMAAVSVFAYPKRDLKLIKKGVNQN